MSWPGVFDHYSKYRLTQRRLRFEKHSMKAIDRENEVNNRYRFRDSQMS